MLQYSQWGPDTDVRAVMTLIFEQINWDSVITEL